MKKIILILIALVTAGAVIGGIGQEKKAAVTNFYETSLHYTNRGLEYWYAKEQGGLERITGIPFSDLPCTRCHVRSCDTCHKKEVEGKPVYSLESVRSQEVCQNCHDIESLAEFKKNPDSPTADGNLHTFVYQNKTMITFAPAFPHLVMKEGRVCGDCHATQVIRDLRQGRLKVVRWENGELKNVRGIVPVLAGQDWDFVFLNYEAGRWIPLKSPDEPLVNFAGYCSPLTEDQFARLEKAPAKK